jgi:hypothetical protein
MSAGVVFLGGATVELYATSSAAPAPRPTLDVDCIVEIASIAQWRDIEDALRRRGFLNDRSVGAPLCRWICQEIKVDVMPTRPEVLGVGNDWYEEAFHHSSSVPLGDGVEVRIPEGPYFLATKMAAMAHRGMIDLRTSTDLEDGVYALLNRGTLVGEIRAADARVKAFLVDAFTRLLFNDILDEAISSVLDRGEPPGTGEKVRLMLVKITTAGKADGAMRE